MWHKQAYNATQLIISYVVTKISGRSLKKHLYDGFRGHENASLNTSTTILLFTQAFLK